MRKIVLFMLCALLTLSQTFAQTQIVTGRVTDDAGNPISGASVQGRGTKAGTTTGTDGSFSLRVPQGIRVLVISSVNFTPQDVAIGTSPVNVRLKSSAENLSEVVVVGYGTKTVRENTGAIAKVSGARVSQEPVVSFDQALAGKTAGVQISLGSGVLADRTAIRVRGINSISSSSQPLVVIDGIPQNTATNLNGFNSGNGTRFDPLALINTNDIESIEVLKDAGASSLYGSRAANGVILITTKRGRRGTVKVNVDSKVGWSSATKLPSLLNGDQFITIMNEKGANRFGATSAYASMAKDSDIDGDGVPDRTNWNDYVYRTGMTYDNTVSLSGGADKISVYGSVRYLKQEGIIRGNALKTGQARLNLDVTPKSWFRSGIQLSYSKTLNNGVLTDAYIAGTTITGMQSPPNVSPFNPNGPRGYNLTANGLLGLGNNVTTVGGVSYLPSTSYYPNIVPTIDLQRNDNTAEDLRASVYGELQPIKGLKLTSKFGIQNLSNFEDQYSSPLISGLGYSYGGLVQDQRQQFNQWVWQNYANFDKTIGRNHKIGIVAGTEYQKTTYFYLYTGAGNFTDPYFTHVVDAAYTNTLPGTTTLLDFTGGNLRSNGLISYFGRASYSFANKYFLEGSLRRDGYSAFGEANQFGTFPSISLGWELTKEKFMQGLTWLDFFKLRGSYGTVGNSRGLSDYAARTLFSGASYTSLNGLGISQAGNAALQWETSKKTDVGFDANFLKSKIGLTVDYFKNNITGLILSAPTLYTVGVPNSSITTNIGGMYNKGLELTLNVTPYSTKNFNWTTSFNFTRIWNQITGLVPSNNNADIVSGVNVASVGKPLGTFYLPNWAGVDAATGNPMWFAKDGTIKRYNFGATGSALWTDDKGASVAALSGSDYVYQDKSGLPTYYGGWDNTFSYKGFDLNVSLNYQGGNYLYNSTLAGMLTNQFSNNFDYILNRWQKPGDVTDVPKLWLNDQTGNQASTRWLEKGDFVRVRIISLGYNVQRSLLTKAGFENARVYVQAFNPFLITKYKGLDPDVNTAGTTQSNIALGVDSRGAPQAKTITVGVNLSF
jgi:TonB-dependent starch-binding outer membrane protein SusC